jgi:hypothetical protein
MGAVSKIRPGVLANALTANKKARQDRMLFETLLLNPEVSIY